MVLTNTGVDSGLKTVLVLLLHDICDIFFQMINSMTWTWTPVRGEKKVKNTALRQCQLKRTLMFGFKDRNHEQCSRDIDVTP